MGVLPVHPAEKAVTQKICLPWPEGTGEAVSYATPSCLEDRVNVALSSCRMNSRPKDPKTARNKNMLVIGGSGSGKTRYHIKPNLLQMNASYVCSDPKGTVVEEVGCALVRGGYQIKILNTIDFS